MRDQSIIVCEEGVYVAGYSQGGHLGTGVSTDVVKQFKRIHFPVKISTAQASGSHIVALDEEGNLWTCGSKDYLGHVSKNSNLPSRIPYFATIISIAVGGGFTLALDCNGVCYGFGNNLHGGLGLGRPSEAPISTPKTIPVQDCKAVAAGSYHSLILDKEGILWGAGGNAKGQLGPTVAYFNNNFWHKISDIKFAKISAGDDFTVALCTDGTPWVTGYGGFGQLGLGKGTLQCQTLTPVLSLKEKIVDVLACGPRVFYTDSEKNTWACGKDSDWNCGVNGNWLYEPVLVPFTISRFVFANYDHFFFADVAGNIFGVGSNTFCKLGLPDDVKLAREPTLIPGLTLSGQTVVIKSARTAQPSNFSDAPAPEPALESPDSSDEEVEVVNDVEPFNTQISIQPPVTEQVETSVQEAPLQTKSPVMEQEPNIALENKPPAKKPSRLRKLFNLVNKK